MGKGLSGRGEEEDIMEELHRELKAKGETIELLQARVAAMEQQESNREREVDILRQSMRIMSHKNKPTKIAKGLSRSLHL
ncbi:unnamed protein product [Ilex paraguariensis]|uniref:Uncharacterized protein n=1 Tax=Ilex paraguariensis TaxID=185542 RepID=A0ABC8UU18_9AQUA